MKATSQRTQIILPKSLREAIEAQRRLTGESLAEYLRTAAKERLQREKKKKVDLKKLADEVIGSSKPGNGGWGDVDLEQWRKERQEEDDDVTRRLDKAWKSSPKTSKRSEKEVFDNVLKLGDK